MFKNLPQQKVSSNSKTKAWFEECAITAMNLALDETSSIKPLIETIIENYNLYDGQVDPESIKQRFTNDLLKNTQLNPSFAHFSVIRDRIDELVGEFIEKDNEFVIASINPEAINSKLVERKKSAIKLITNIVSNDSITDKEIMAKLETFVNTNFLSRAEIVASTVLQFYRKAHKLDYKELEAFREALITAVVVFYVGIEHDRLVIRKTSPERIFAVRNGTSNDIKDAEIIAEVEFLPKGKIIDKFSEHLSETQIKDIIDENLIADEAWLENKKSLTFGSMEELNRFTKGISNNASTTIYESIDANGNIKVTKVSWKGFRKIYHRKYYDANGDVQYDYVSEKHVKDESRGEELKTLWITEWHEADIIGDAMVVNGKVREVQLRDPSMPFESFSGYVGGFFNVGNNKARSMVDMAKSYIYFRDILFARVEDLLASNIGKVITLDLSKIPKNWSMNKWYSMLKIHRIKVIDSFNEGEKGVATGKLAGQYNPSTRPDDMDTSASIQAYLGMIQMTDQMIAKVTGVTDQRLGAISQHELVGNVNRSMIQSSLITEIWFKRFESILLDLYELIIESSKKVLNSDTRLQTVLDDFNMTILTSFDEFKFSTFGLYPINTRKYDELRNILKQIAVNAIPNGQMTSTQLIRLYKASSVFDMLEVQENLDRETRERVVKEQEMQHARQLELVQSEQQAEAQRVKAEQDFQMQLETLKQEYKLKIEELKILDKAQSDAFGQYYTDSNKNGISDSIELEKQRMINQQKDKELAFKDKELNLLVSKK